jgi:hypothetical protein
VENGWLLKRFHRQVMTSRTYRQSSTMRPEAMQIDADNRLLWRMPVRRLEAEAVRDSVLAVSGSLCRDPFGPPVSTVVSDGGLVTVDDAGAGRRSLYVQFRRTQPVYLLETFDTPNMEPNCERRVSSTVATQSLTMLNDPFVIAQAEALAERLERENGDGSKIDDQITQLWHLAFNRPPRSEELGLLTAHVTDLAEVFKQRKVKHPQRSAMASLCQVVFGTNEFLYIQ